MGTRAFPLPFLTRAHYQFTDRLKVFPMKSVSEFVFALKPIHFMVLRNGVSRWVAFYHSSMR